MLRIITLAITLTTISCATDETAKSNKENITKSNTDIVTNSLSPCQLVDETEIKILFDIPAATVTEIRDEVKTYPTCFYKWETVTYSETKTISNQVVNLDYPTEMMIVLVNNATPKMFDTSTKVYKDGISVSDIGEMAIWGEKMSQLTFLAKGSMIHLHVKKSSLASDNKELALKIATIIINKL